jgi:serine/threonine protein kinase/Tfp pilus assembly protein PilF
MIGQTISHYRILEKLGEGGMGVVYKAEDTKLKRTVAIKFLPKHLAKHGEERERFLHEAQAASSLNHPNICTIYEIDEMNDETFIVMECIDGVTLREWISRKINEGEGYRKLAVREALDLALQIAEGLHAAHEKQIVHRDVKSENVMVTVDGRAKIMDFGLAKLQGASKLTKTGSTIGTIAYMSPEQVEGLETDHRTDIFSFGVLLYEMLSGKLPFQAVHEAALMYEIINVEPPALSSIRQSVDEEVNRIVMKCLEKDRDTRYQSMREVVADLKRHRRDSEGKKLERTASPVRQEPPSVETQEQIPRPKRSRIPLITVTAVVIMVIAGLIYYLSTRSTMPITSIAVLPLNNATADSSSEYLSDGFTESLINSLSKLPGMKLMSRSSVFRFKGKDIDPQKAGKDLGVGAVLTGRLTQRGDALMVSVELVDVKDNSHIWGNQYERKLSDILALQSDISQEISNQLKITLTGDQQRALIEHPTENTEAYKLYLQGLFYWNKRTRDGFEKALSFYQQAINKDPSYALAYAGLANVYDLLGSYSIIPAEESVEKARAMAQKAIQFDERLAEAHTVLAAVYDNYEWKWVDAEREYKRATDLNPNYATAHQWYGEFLCAMRRFDEGNAHHQRSIEIDPLSPVTYAAAGYDFMVQRRYEEATKMLTKSLEINPSFPRGIDIRAQLSFLTGKSKEALKDMRAAVALSDSGDEYVAYLGNILGLRGNRVEATTLLRTLLERQQSHYVDPSLIALVYMGLGEKDQAFQWLDKAYEVHSNQVEYLLVDPLYDPIRSDPRFATLVKKIGLPQ